jgi:hypothetical protein
VNFDDLVDRSRQCGQDGKPAAEAPEAVLRHARETLDAALAETGLAAAMTLASRGVSPVPVGHIKRRFGFDYPEQTSHAWRFPRGLHLLRDGTWWRVRKATASAESAPPPLVRWVMDDDPHAAGSILAPQQQLTGAVLSEPGPAVGDAPCGTFVIETDDKAETLHLSVADGVARISEDAGGDPVPFEEWAAAAVASLIDAR